MSPELSDLENPIGDLDTTVDAIGALVNVMDSEEGLRPVSVEKPSSVASGCFAS